MHRVHLPPEVSNAQDVACVPRASKRRRVAARICILQRIREGRVEAHAYACAAGSAAAVGPRQDEA